MKIIDFGRSATSLVATQEAVKRQALRTRRDLIEALSIEYADGHRFIEMMSITDKELRRKDKCTQLIIQTAKNMGLGSVFKREAPTQNDIKSIVKNLRFLAAHPQYASNSFEVHTSPAFQHALGLLSTLKVVCRRIPNSVDLKAKMACLDAVADINIRLYSMYVDERL